MARSWPFAALLASLALGACTPAPDPAAVERQAGDDLFRKQDWIQAAAAYQRSLDANPKQEKTWEKLAAALMRAERRDQAAQALVKTLEFKKDAAQKAEVYRSAAGVFLQSAQRDQAKPYLLEALKLEPKDEASISWLGELAAFRGGARSNEMPAVAEELDEALVWYGKLIELKPESRAAWAHRRVVLVKYTNLLLERQRAAAESARQKRGAEQAAARERAATLGAKAQELAKQVEEIDRKLAELKKAQAAAAKK